MLRIHGAVGNGAIHNKCGPERTRWKIPWRRGVGRRTAEPWRRGGGRRKKGSDREFFSNPVYFVLNFAKKTIFVVFYETNGLPAQIRTTIMSDLRVSHFCTFYVSMFTCTVTSPLHAT
jgi:hypothetical protein